MSSQDKHGLRDRIEQLRTERADSIDKFVEELEFVTQLDPVEQEFNDAYAETVELYGEEYAPFMFTKGMPLATDDDGARYPEGIVPLSRKERRYRDPIQNRADPAGEFPQGGQRLFIGIPGVHTVSLSGMDPWRGIMPPAPDPTGPENAGEMIDLYAMEQLRDVPFTAWPNEPGGDGTRSPSEIQTDPDAPQALRDTLTALESDLDASLAAGAERWYDSDRLFVEADAGGTSAWGPYVSQFLLQEVPLWSLPVDQQYLRYERGRDHNNYLEDWLNTLEGRDEHSAELDPNTPSRENRGYISTPRHLATIVNAEPPYQEYLIAAVRLLGQVDFDPDMAYLTRDDGAVFDYTDGGPVGLLDMVARVCRQALLAAFYQKYYVHFRCRPETYGGRVHAQLRDKSEFGIPELLTESAILDARPAETDYLSTVYEEGSPVHPAYPSGHSVIAGAAGTVLKTWFDDADWPDDLPYYVPTHEGDEYGTGLTAVPVPSGHNGVYQEIDKLMSNVGLARMFAGVHYYSDHYEAVKLGEQVAVGTMADVFDSAFAATGDVRPTFTPYLDYDAEHEVSVETLDTLRKQAAQR